MGCTRLLVVGMLAVAGAVAGSNTLRGTLVQSPVPMLKTEDGRRILLEGDADTTAVINDQRLAGAELEAAGKFVSPGRFRIGPIHKRSLWVWKHGQKHSISYWCDVCAIRTYTPGICMCCQQETKLELRPAEPLDQ